MGEVREFFINLTLECEDGSFDCFPAKQDELDADHLLRLIAKADLQPHINDLKNHADYCNDEGCFMICGAVTRFLKAWEGKNGTE